MRLPWTQTKRAIPYTKLTLTLDLVLVLVLVLVMVLVLALALVLVLVLALVLAMVLVFVFTREPCSLKAAMPKEPLFFKPGHESLFTESGYAERAVLTRILQTGSRAPFYRKRLRWKSRFDENSSNRLGPGCQNPAIPGNP